MKWVVGGLLVLALLWAVWRGISDRDRAEAEKRAYHDSTAVLRDSLRDALTHRDTVVKRVPVERVKIVRDSARVDTLKLELAADSTVRDSLDTALEVIAAQDTLIDRQRSHMGTLNALAEADSGVIQLLRAQRVVDSLRIAGLERPQGINLGIVRVRFRCVGGVTGIGYPKVVGGLGVTCGIGL